MTALPWLHRFAFAFGIAFGPLYAITVKFELAAFTVYPSLGIVLLGTRRPLDVVAPSMAFLAPGMYWYGWTTTAAMGATLFAVPAACWRSGWARGVWLAGLWLLPTLAMAACVYVTMPLFRL